MRTLRLAGPGTALLAAGAILGALFINRTAASILVLEKATKRLAAGDLDFALAVRGAETIPNLNGGIVQKNIT